MAPVAVDVYRPATPEEISRSERLGLLPPRSKTPDGRARRAWLLWWSLHRNAEAAGGRLVAAWGDRADVVIQRRRHTQALRRQRAYVDRRHVGVAEQAPDDGLEVDFVADDSVVLVVHRVVSAIGAQHPRPGRTEGNSAAAPLFRWRQTDGVGCRDRLRRSCGSRQGGRDRSRVRADRSCRGWKCCSLLFYWVAPTKPPSRTSQRRRL